MALAARSSLCCMLAGGLISIPSNDGGGPLLGGPPAGGPGGLNGGLDANPCSWSKVKRGGIPRGGPSGGPGKRGCPGGGCMGLLFILSKLGIPPGRRGPPSRAPAGLLAAGNRGNPGGG